MADKKTSYTPHNRTSIGQLAARETLHTLFRNRPMPEDQLLVNLGMYARSSVLAKLLFLDELYRQITPLSGVMMVFGTWWGQDVVVLHNLRAVHEPYNSLRRIIGFDTFEGYPQPTGEDKLSDTVKQGAYDTAAGHPKYLAQLLDYHNSENVMGHIAKHELIKGDVMSTLEAYLVQHEETLVALAYLDLALYAPTKRVLELLKPRLVKGAVLAMDELNSAEYPGETQAFREVFDLNQTRVHRSAFLPDRTYAVI